MTPELENALYKPFRGFALYEKRRHVLVAASIYVIVVRRTSHATRGQVVASLGDIRWSYLLLSLSVYRFRVRLSMFDDREMIVRSLMQSSLTYICSLHLCTMLHILIAPNSSQSLHSCEIHEKYHCKLDQELSRSWICLFYKKKKQQKKNNIVLYRYSKFGHYWR